MEIMNPTTAVSVILGVSATIVSLIAWLIKASFRRQDEVTDRYFKHLEYSAESQRRESDQYKATLAKIEETLTAQTMVLRSLAEDLKSGAGCRHAER